MAVLERRISAVEASCTTQANTILNQQLRLEEMEDRSRRNNLRLRGLPEATGAEDLTATIMAIFRDLMGELYPNSLSFDRIHRALGPRSTDLERPRDVICRIHQYAQKEMILRAAWEKGNMEFDGACIRIMPDLSRPTLQRRALLRPVLEAARRSGATYRWGFPISVIVKKAQHSFTLRNPTDLPALFTFLEIEPVEVPDWLQMLQPYNSRTGPSHQRRARSPRPQRNRNRPRYSSTEAPRED